MASIQKYTTKTKGSLYLFKAVTGYDRYGKAITTTRRGFKTKKQAKDAAVDFELSVKNGGIVTDTNASFEAIAFEWLDKHKNEVKQSTIKSQRSKINTACIYFGNRRIKDIKRKEIENMISDLLDNDHKEGMKKSGKYERGSVNNIFQVVKMVFKYAKIYDLINIDPTVDVTLPNRVKKLADKKQDKMKFLNKSELLVFLDTVNKNSLDIEHAYLHLLAYSGMRAGEALALQWTDVDFKNNTLDINKTLFTDGNSNKRYELNTPKSEASNRLISIDPSVIDLLKKLKQYQNKSKLAFGKGYHDANFVFAAPDGRPKTIGFMQWRLERICKMYGSKVNLHMLRHTHTSLCISSGMSIFEIQKRLGHSDIQTTMNVYAHLTKETEEIAAEKFSSFMSK